MIDPADHIISKSLLAGAVIGIGGFLFLSSQCSLIGALLVSICFLSCSILKLNNFTDKSGCLSDYIDFRRLILVLLLNVVATFIFGLISKFLNLSIVSVADKCVNTILATDYATCAVTSLAVGFIMMLAAEFRRESSGNLLYIMCVSGLLATGYSNCVLDSFYYGASSVLYDNVWSLTSRLLVVILFNFIGCNLYNLSVNRSLIHRV